MAIKAFVTFVLYRRVLEQFPVLANLLSVLTISDQYQVWALHYISFLPGCAQDFWVQACLTKSALTTGANMHSQIQNSPRIIGFLLIWCCLQIVGQMHCCNVFFRWFWREFSGVVAISTLELLATWSLSIWLVFHWASPWLLQPTWEHSACGLGCWLPVLCRYVRGVFLLQSNFVIAGFSMLIMSSGMTSRILHW